MKYPLQEEYLKIKYLILYQKEHFKEGMNSRQLLEYIHDQRIYVESMLAKENYEK